MQPFATFLFDSPGRKAGDRIAKRAFRRSIPGIPAEAIKDQGQVTFVSILLKLTVCLLGVVTVTVTSCRSLAGAGHPAGIGAGVMATDLV